MDSSGFSYPCVGVLDPVGWVWGRGVVAGTSFAQVILKLLNQLKFPGSIASAIHSAIGNVPKGHIFAFLQSYGAGGFAKRAMRMAGGWFIVALLLAAVGKLLMEN